MIKRKYNNKTIWTAQDGKNVAIKDLQDTHLANIIKHVKFYAGYPLGIKRVLKNEAKRRGLTQEFLDKAPYPFKHKNGKWHIWDFKLNNSFPIKDFRSLIYAQIKDNENKS